MNIAGYKISTFNFGNFKLDGGSMFGSVPKTMWSKVIPVDDKNRIPLATRCLILEKGSDKILIDCGNGNKWSEKENEIFAFEHAEITFDTNSITHLLLTHLHFDHAGGISYFDSNKNLCPTFPNAKVLVQKSNFENAASPNIRERASYLKDNVSIITKGKYELIEGECEILPGIKVHPINGHTIGQQWIEIFDESTTLLYPSDLIPTMRHLPLPYHMGYDMCAQTILDEKKFFLEYALKKDAIIVSEHDPDTSAVKIQLNAKGYAEIKEVVQIDL